MTPERKKIVKDNVIEEFYWNGKYVVYVNNKKVDTDFESTCKNIED